MLSFYQAAILGITQGISELFPISSLGHSVIIPTALGWHINQKDPFFLSFLVATHAATALVLFVFFWRDWKMILSGIFRSLKEREIGKDNYYAKLGWLLVIGTIPAGVLGLLFEDLLKTLFAKAQFTAAVLILNGLMLFGAEFLRRRKEKKEKGSDQRIAKLTWGQSLKIGFLQSLALIPGFSRTGAAITGGLLTGLSHEDAARFSFLLATPIIGAAALLKLPELTLKQDYLGPTLLGAVLSGIFAYLSVKFLVKYFQTKNLTPFGVYCILVGALFLFFFR
jgi:undecaprenyl-diphosphatase